MTGPISPKKALASAGLLMIVLLILAAAGRKAGAGLGFSPPTWMRELPADQCPGTNNTACSYGSPVFADIDNDQAIDIVLATNNGHIVVFRMDGTKLWDTDIAPYFGMAPGTNEIHSSPAVEDIDNDGFAEIIVGVGTLNPSVCTQGGLIVLNHLGKVEPGWPFFSLGSETSPAGCRDTIVSSPSVGDLDNDGDLEIVAAGFDKRIYAWHHDGSLVKGFPPDSALRDRFPTWNNLIGRLADNTWGSPALADLDRDGFLDIIIGTAEGNFDARWGGNAGGWTCPYTLPDGWAEGYCGGSLYAFNRFGKTLPGFPKYFHEIISSSPAVSDVNEDGQYEIFVGTGNFYYRFSPDHPTNGFRLYGFDHQGNDLPGWEGGKVTGGSVVMSPSIGDITGDSKPEVVVLAADNKVYAWHINGQKVSGFPMTPRDFIGNNSGPFDVIKGLVLADYDGDGKMEIIFGQGWAINVVDGDGRQLTGSNYPNNSNPIYNAQGIILNTPAVDDIDNDGNLELVATNNKIFLWDIERSSAKSDWPMFKTAANRTGVFPQPQLDVNAKSIVLLHQTGDPKNATGVITIRNAGSGSFTWTANFPPGIGFSSSSGVVTEDTPSTITISVPTAGLRDGTYDLGSITIKATLDIGVVKDVLSVHPVKLIISDLHRAFTPIVSNR
ncbi:MAG: pyrrolo-quinoline quinone [Anaerolineae bacterium]|nr:MAG: pyrrolo-quinoline quinone [Anaerolineae bacterium]